MILIFFANLTLHTSQYIPWESSFRHLLTGISGCHRCLGVPTNNDSLPNLLGLPPSAPGIMIISIPDDIVCACINTSPTNWWTSMICAHAAQLSISFVGPHYCGNPVHKCKLQCSFQFFMCLASQITNSLAGPLCGSSSHYRFICQMS